MEKTNLMRSDKKFRDSSWDNSYQFGTSDQFSWPQRNYSCNFCKKDFKSAQALGGHMNVHRRERAKLRFSPSSDILNPNPNPRFLPYFSNCHSFGTLSSTSSASTDEEKKMLIRPMSYGIGKLKSFISQEDESRVLKKKDNTENLDLGLGLLSDDPKEDLDLELRLGYS